MIKILFKLIIIFLLLHNYALAETSQEVDKISKNLRCLICQGQSFYDPQSDFALIMKILTQNKIVEGKMIPASGEIFAKQIIPQMLYKTHFEGSSVKNAMNWAEGEMNKIVNK